MNWKEFFRPTFGKIILFAILMCVLNYFIISITYLIISDADVSRAVVEGKRIMVGIPLGFWPIGSFTRFRWPETPTPSTVESFIKFISDFSFINFIIDIIFWYVVSSAIITLRHKKIMIKSRLPIKEQTWKEFFKPTFGKIILFIGFFLIFPAHFIEGRVSSLGDITTEFIPLFGGFITIVLILSDLFFNLLVVLSMGVTPDFDLVFMHFNIGFFIYSLTISYFLSCLISLFIIGKKVLLSKYERSSKQPIYHKLLSKGFVGIIFLIGAFLIMFELPSDVTKNQVLIAEVISFILFIMGVVIILNSKKKIFQST